MGTKPRRGTNGEGRLSKLQENRQGLEHALKSLCKNVDFVSKVMDRPATGKGRVTGTP